MKIPEGLHMKMSSGLMVNEEVLQSFSLAVV